MRSCFRLMSALLCGALFLTLIPTVQGAEEEAQDISGIERIPDPEKNAACLFDGDTTHAVTIHDSLTLHAPQGMGSAYLIFDMEYGAYTVTDPEKGTSATFGQQGFLHEFLDLEEAFGYAPQTVTFSFPTGDAKINELSLFTSGEVPDYVQKWEAPKEGKTDLMLFSAHGDDEHLFFAGLLPDYAAERKYEVLVVYLTNHRNRGTLRCHEMLNGLWFAGVTTYPVFGPFSDLFSTSKDQAYTLHQRRGESDEALLGFVVEQLRRFRPQVVVGHDRNGEYGHGQHAMFSELLRRGVEAAEDPNRYPDLAYGTWQVPKAYLHLWPENPITLDWDRPLSHFDGMTAFQVSVNRGFACHKSQVGGVTGCITDYGAAADIPRYSPCEYGLYRTTVGADMERNDFFENLTSYHAQEVAAAIARNQEASLEASQIAHAFAEIQQLKSDRQQESRLIQDRIETLVRREAQLRRWIGLSLFAAVLAAAGLVFIFPGKRKK